ncbi:MAG TPA: EutN/CcmL family microcompartment protein [Myxococcota bacterium]|nr:EutN/CcmL family microcompartment protein [Myxococcota bacterium]HOH77616.1 EutN/CcmL family microcompartment protein [Myxococcota bacterium]
MYLGRVIGTVVASRKAAGLNGIRLMAVIPINHDGSDRAQMIVAADAVNSGPGDIVHLVGSREASLAFSDQFVPLDAAIVGIVDQIHIPEEP